MSEPYRDRLEKGELLFRVFCRRNGSSPEQVAHDPDLASDWLVRYLQWAFDQDEPFSKALHAILAMQTKFRHLRGKLKATWDSIMSWKMTRGVSSRVPARLEIVRALSYTAALAAWTNSLGAVPLWMAFCFCVRVAFFSLLRPKELFGLRRRHLQMLGPGCFRDLAVLLLRIDDPKNKYHLGRVQVRLVRDPPTISWAIWLFASAPPNFPVWPSTPSAFRRFMSRLCHFLHLKNVGLTPSSFQAGGATRLLEEGHPVSSIRFQGGWASERSLSPYLQEADAASTLLSLPSADAFRLETVLDALAFAEWPPDSHSAARRDGLPLRGTGLEARSDVGRRPRGAGDFDSE